MKASTEVKEEKAAKQKEAMDVPAALETLTKHDPTITTVELPSKTDGTSAGVIETPTKVRQISTPGKNISSKKRTRQDISDGEDLKETNHSARKRTQTAATTPRSTSKQVTPSGGSARQVAPDQADCKSFYQVLSAMLISASLLAYQSVRSEGEGEGSYRDQSRGFAIIW